MRARAFRGMSSFELMFFTPEDGLNLVRNLLSRLPINLVLRLSSVSRILHDVVKNYQREVWDIDKYLSNWVTNPRVFRIRLGECDAVISGWHALQFFERSFDPGQKYDSELEIFTRLDGVLQMGYHLQSQGYVFDAFTLLEDPAFDVHVKSLVLSVRQTYNLPYLCRNRILH
jgi:hypothetical protein